MTSNKFKYKKAFALFITISLLMLFSFLSISIVETQTISTNIDKLKYLHLQATIHMNNTKQFISNNSNIQVEDYTLEDKRFKINITKINEENISRFHISIETINNSKIRLSEFITK